MVSGGTGWTRREALVAGAVGAAGLALPARAPGAARSRRLPARADVVVVGAGLSGLVAAERVAAAGRSVVVLEARRRVGGRVHNTPLGGGEVIEAGAATFGPTQGRILAQAQALGVESFKAHAAGDNVYVEGGAARRYAGLVPPVGPQLLLDAALVQERLNALAERTPVDAPQRARQAAEWDRQTLGTWLRAGAVNGPGLTALLEAFLHARFGADADDLSLLFTAGYIAAAGDEQHVGTFARSASVTGGALESRFVGGSARVPLELARRLGRRRVVLSAPVRRIEQSARGARVVTARGAVRARKVVVAIPPALALGIDFAPGLPPARAQLLQRLPMGRLMKCDAVYDEPFWRGDGLSGMGVLTEGPIRVMFDHSAPDGTPGVLLGFLGGGEWDVWGRRPLTERREAVLRAFARVVGPRALQPRAYLEHDWTRERWTGGGPVAGAVPGALTAFGDELRRPHRHVHWAGTETSTYWTGFMDGAVRAGERAAAEVLAG